MSPFIGWSIEPIWTQKVFRTIDPSLQDNVFIPNDFYEYIYHFGCSINLHSIMNSRFIAGGLSLKKRHTVCFLPVDPMNNEDKDSETIDPKAPRLARYLHTAWRKHQNTVYWVDIRLTQKKVSSSIKTRWKRHLFYNKIPTYCIAKAVKLETGESSRKRT